MKEGGDNILISFPSEYDEKLKVSSLNPKTRVFVVQSDPNLNVNYFDARDIIADFPSLLPSTSTPDGVGAVRIGNRSKRKLIHEIGNYESDLKDAYLRAIPYILEALRKSVLLEEHRDRVKNSLGNRLAINSSDPNIDKVQRLYGVIQLQGLLYRMKTTLQVYRDDAESGKYHGYEITKIELISPKLRNIAEPAINVALNKNSISLANLLKDVELSYESGVKLVEAINACHHFRLTGDSKLMERVFEQGRKARLSSLVGNPMDAIKRAEVDLQRELRNREKQTLNQSDILAEAEERLGKDWKQASLDAPTEQQSRGMKV